MLALPGVRAAVLSEGRMCCIEEPEFGDVVQVSILSVK